MKAPISSRSLQAHGVSWELGKGASSNPSHWLEGSLSLSRPKNESLVWGKISSATASIPIVLQSWAGLWKSYLWADGSAAWWLHFMCSKPMNHCVCVHRMCFFVPGTICIFLTVLPVDTAHLNCTCVGITAQFMSCSNLPHRGLPASQKRQGKRRFTEFL